MTTESMFLFNRITDQTETAEDVPIIGLYTLNESSGIHYKQGDYWLSRLVESGHADSSDGIPSLLKNHLPSEQERNAITALMGDLIEQSGAYSWQHLIDKHVFFPAKNPEALKLQPIEQFLQQNLVHVQTVNRRPRTHLQTEIERTSSSQARRIPSHAYQHLAAHTEDWAYQRFSKVVPRRILSITTEDRYQIYENLVAASLKVQLYRDLMEREQSLDKIMEVLNSGKNPQDGSYRKLSRQYKMLGKLFDSYENPVESLGNTKKQISGMRQQLGALHDETLLQQIPHARNLPLPASLRVTNIFVNDKHYRYIRLLWEKHQKHRARKSLTLEQMQHELQTLHHAFEAFCLTLIVRALDTLHLSPIDKRADSLLERGSQLSLEHRKCPQIAIDLHYTGHGVFEIVMQKKPIARVVPLLEALAQDTVTATERFKKIAEMIRNRQTIPTFVLYPALNHELGQLTGEARKLACDLGNEGNSQNRLQVGFVPISPNELDSLERVGRALRWIIWSTLFAFYPFKIDVPSRLRSQVAEQANGWLRNTDSALVLTNTVKASDRNKLYTWMKTCRTQQRTLAFSDNERDDIEKSLELASAQLMTIVHCPICGTNCLSEFKPREGDGFYFLCSCDSCGIEWGTNDCGTCHQSIPFIKLVVPDVKQSAPDWISAAYGMDVLAIPTNFGHFVCPHCQNDN